MLFDDNRLEEVIGDPTDEEIHAIEGGGGLGEVIFAEPSGGEGDEREPKEEMEICPEDFAADVMDGVEHVVVVVPIDAYVNKAEEVTEECGYERLDVAQI